MDLSNFIRLRRRPWACLWRNAKGYIATADFAPRPRRRMKPAKSVFALKLRRTRRSLSEAWPNAKAFGRRRVIKKGPRPWTWGSRGQQNRIFSQSLTLICFFFILTISLPLFAQEKQSEQIPVEINGDQVEYSVEENKFTAHGNVVVQRQDVTLYCDKLEFFRETKLAIAEGHVVLVRGEGRMEGERMRFNFDTMKGEFLEAKMYSKPFFGQGEKVSKIADNHMQVQRGYITTCDLAKPHYRFVARKVDIYPHDKAVSRHVRMHVGKMPLVYIPKFVQDLRGKEPVVTYTPGYDKNWGAFLLTNWQYKLHSNLKSNLHLDYRERKDLAWGVDADYRIPNYGNGLIRTYYMHERNVDKKHRFWEERRIPTLEKERFKGQWRHQWTINDRSGAILQFYRLSDNDFLKEYFRREFEKESSPQTYFLYSYSVPAGTFGFRTDARVNRFLSTVERLPELSFDSTNKEIFDTGFYLKNTTTYSNLTKKDASPTEVRKETMRVDSNNQISYPFKLMFFEIKPYVGGRQTYYSKAIDPDKYNSIRGLFTTGSDLSTKFYRIYDIYTDALGLNIKRLRHIITPSVAYQYTHDPTIPNNNDYDQFDSLDKMARGHGIIFAVENKLQTKRDLKSVDLLRTIISTDFFLKEHPGNVGGFNTLKADVELTPYEWLAFLLDSTYDTRTRRLNEVNFDLLLNDGGDKWFLKFGKRWKGHRVDDQITTQMGYRPNQKWIFKVYQRYDVEKGILKEQEYAFVRDLHCWTVEVNFNETRGLGGEIWLVFTLKDFPEIGIDWGTSFNRRKPGSQSEGF